MPSRVNDPEMLLWPRLSRFYGLSFSELRRMKRPFVRMYAEQMETIHAEEMLDRLTVSAFPYMEEADHKKTHTHYARIVKAERRASESANPGPVERKPLPDPGALAALGIAVVRKEPAKPEVE